MIIPLRTSLKNIPHHKPAWDVRRTIKKNNQVIVKGSTVLHDLQDLSVILCSSDNLCGSIVLTNS